MLCTFWSQCLFDLKTQVRYAADVLCCIVGVVNIVLFLILGNSDLSSYRSFPLERFLFEEKSKPIFLALIWESNIRCCVCCEQCAVTCIWMLAVSHRSAILNPKWQDRLHERSFPLILFTSKVHCKKTYITYVFPEWCNKDEIRLRLLAWIVLFTLSNVWNNILVLFRFDKNRPKFRTPVFMCWSPNLVWFHLEIYSIL